jgi:histidinol phosphatase-like enzyme (inositol monophosphatase family)
MSPFRNADLLEAVAEAARVCGGIAMQYFGKDIGVDTKSDGTPVTQADRAAEHAVREWLSTRFPDDTLVGEEHGATPGSSRRTWLIDPIDGTKSFIRGIPMWGSMIAVSEGDEVLAGAINCAATGELVAAARGRGCYLNGARCTVSGTTVLESATILSTDVTFPYNPERTQRWEPLARRVAMSRTWGDCYGYMLVATGRADLMVDDRLNPWDAAALMPIIEEAGGMFTDWSGAHTMHGGDAIATNGALGPAFRRALGVPDARAMR